VVLTSASIFLDGGVEPHSLAAATGVVPLVQAVAELWSHGMEGAVVHLCSNETISAVTTGKLRETSVKLEESLLPRKILLLTEVHNELIDVP